MEGHVFNGRDDVPGSRRAMIRVGRYARYKDRSRYQARPHFKCRCVDGPRAWAGATTTTGYRKCSKHQRRPNGRKRSARREYPRLGAIQQEDEMKHLVIFGLVMTLSGCGWFDRYFTANLTGWSRTCVEGVAYLQFPSGVTVEYTVEGKIKTCR